MPAPTPDIIIEPFGTGNAGSITLPIPVPSQLPGNPGYASFQDGFPSDTSGAGSLPPRWQDMQGILYMITAYQVAQTGGQFWPYSSTWSSENSGYAVGAIVLMANGQGFWINLSSGNTNNPDTTAAATSNWVPFGAYGTSSITLSNANVTLTSVQAATPQIVLTGTLTANVQVIFPTWYQRWRVINNCTGNYTVTAKTSSGTGIYIAPLSSYGASDIYCDGTSIWPLFSQVSKLHAMAVLSSNSTRTSTTTLSADSTLQQTIFLPGTYIVRMWLNDRGATSTGGLSANIGFSGSLSSLAFWSSTSNGTLYVNNANNESITTSPSSGFSLQTEQTGNASMFLTGCFTCTTQGTLALWWAQTTSNSTASQISPGSFLEVLPAINLTSLA
jgi:hypothetical protein